LKVDESSITGESDLIEKCTLDDVVNDKLTNLFSILISGSLINEGTAYGIVLTVGDNT